MSNDFMSAMKKTLNDEYNVAFTENGAAGYRTTGKSLLDLNFAVASLRKATPGDIAARFTRAFFEDQVAAMKWLFFARDIRGGLVSAAYSASCSSTWRRAIPITSSP